jgi:hypothetical protein
MFTTPNGHGELPNPFIMLIKAVAQIGKAMRYKKRYFTEPKVPKDLKFHELINLTNQFLWKNDVNKSM